VRNRILAWQEKHSNGSRFNFDAMLLTFVGPLRLRLRLADGIVS